MAISKCNVDTDVISNLPDAPALNAEDLKAKFDEAADNIKRYINEIQNTEIEKMIEGVAASAKKSIDQVTKDLDDKYSYQTVETF